jgi:hypothetical protein
MRKRTENNDTTNAAATAKSKTIEPRERAAVRRFACGASAGVGGATAHHRGVFRV